MPVFPHTIKVYTINKQLIPDSLYSINYKKAYLIFKNYIADSLIVEYIPLNAILANVYFDKPLSLIIKDSSKFSADHSLAYYTEESSFFQQEELVKRGSLSRSIRIGNNQNMSVASTLNLQLSGKIGDDYELTAALSDNQIPFQPSGNTQQIQEFDKIYIQIFNKKNYFTLGDYELRSFDHPFVKVNRKSQGIQYVYKKDESHESILFQTSNSVSKGKYNRMAFNGKEGVQGPYKLSGANNEPFIVILAGTEHIYIDGRLLVRGEENDYIIDYNTAELTFTARNPITKDSRIVAEFEYSDRNYARFMTFNKYQYKSYKTTVNFQLFHEFDAKNQTLQQSLTEREKLILASAGNDESKAVAPFISFDTIRNENQIYYRLIDTLVNGTLYDSILVYSTDSTAKYTAGFTYVGKNKGNYIQTATTANGRVFKWVAPINGIMQGEFEPIRKLIAPIKHTVAAGSISYQLSKKIKTSLDIALSDYDKNTYSIKNNNQNKGIALRTSLHHQLTSDSSQHYLAYEAFGQYISIYFRSPEFFKTVEFIRDWNYNLSSNHEEFMSGLNFIYRYKKSLKSHIGSSFLQAPGEFLGIKNDVQITYQPKKWLFQHNGSLLNSKRQNLNTLFLRHYSQNERQISFFKLGVKTAIEDNQWRNNGSDSLLLNSFRFYRWDTYVATNDTSRVFWLLRYGERKDFIPDSNRFKQSFTTRDASVEIQSTSNKIFNIQSILTLRELRAHKDTIPSKEQNLISRNQISLSIAKQAIQLNTIHETNAGLEPKRQFIYIEVPAGQGIYTWIDYNQNGIKELNEFEVAQFPDQATYLRIASPTLEYIKVFSSKIGQTLSLRPELCLYDKKGILKFLTKFSNQASIQQEIKTTTTSLLNRMLPLPTNDTNQLMVNTSFRNIFSILKTHPVIGIDYIFLYQQNEQLLIQGLDKRYVKHHSITLRWNISQVSGMFLSPAYENKSFTSEYFSEKNYLIESKQIEGTIYYQPNNDSRISSAIKNQQKNNISVTEKLHTINLVLEWRKNIASDNFLTAKIEFINNQYNATANSSVAYEMLEGLQPGWNQVITIQGQRNLSSTLQMVITYQARAAEHTKTIHTGNIEVRAFF